MKPLVVQCIESLRLLSNSQRPRWISLEMPIGSGRSSRTAQYLAREGHDVLWIAPAAIHQQLESIRAAQIVTPNAAFEKIFLPQGGVVVIDEAHHFPSDFATKLVQLLRNNPSATLLTMETSSSGFRDKVTSAVRGLCDGTFGSDDPTSWTIVEGTDGSTTTPQDVINTLVEKLAYPTPAPSWVAEFQAQFYTLSNSNHGS